MLRSDMNLKIKTGTVGYNNKILISDEKFSLGKNEKVNSLETPATQTDYSNEVQANATNITHKNQEPQTITHNEGKVL